MQYSRLFINQGKDEVYFPNKGKRIFSNKKNVFRLQRINIFFTNRQLSPAFVKRKFK